MKTVLALESGLTDQTDILVNRTAHFVGEWIEDHAAETPPTIPADVAAETLANACLAEAKRHGILPDEINDEVGDLKDYMIETVLEAELPPDSAKD